ncbi:hypothetical protein NYO99_12770 [Pelomonas sp. UHG3]|uniref:Uncharacterized protein n=1 Tax=Roseateles hydrophilus TaxID=2975054 RepID=A0ACC6CBX8_9BURK|nr:hypothetical protein [Pelomonas sp. UHG3]MCY4745849.1 hypothetical protein [Pelomonas sp. UHG3]
MQAIARSMFRGILYVGVWTLITLAGAAAGFWWSLSGVPEPAIGDGFGALLNSLLGLCLGGGFGLIVVGCLASALAARRRQRMADAG